MKKIMILVTSIVMSLSIGITAFASGETTLKGEAGITPDSILYPLDTTIDNIKVSLASSDEAKADVLSDIAEERLGESEAMVGENKQTLADTALNDYKSNMDEAESKIENAIESCQTTDDADKLKKLTDVENKIIDKQKKSIDVLTKLQDKLPDSSKDVIAKVIEMQTAKRNAILAVKKERTVYNDAKKQYNEAKAALESAKKSGDETAIKAAEDLLQQKKVALDTQKQTLAKAIEVKKEASKISVGKSIKKDKDQTKKNLKNNETTKADKKGTAPTTTTTTTTTNTETTNTTAASSNSTQTKPASAKSTSVTSETTKTQTPKPTIKNETKTEVTNNKNKEENKNKENNGNNQKNEKAQH